MAGRARRVGRVALRVGAALLLAVALGEGLLRLPPLARRLSWEPPTYPGERASRPSAAFVPDPDVGWRMRPEHSFEWETEGRSVRYVAGADGFRVGGQRAGGGARPHRVALLGDSFVWGFGVSWEESLAGLLEARFPDWEVLDLGMPGFGLDQIALALERWALPRAPDLVVVAFLSDDLARVETAYRAVEGFEKPLFHLRRGALAATTAADAPGALRRFLERRSMLVRLAHQLERVLGKRLGRGGWWALNRALFERMAGALAEAGAPALFVHIPRAGGAPIPALRAFFDGSGLELLDLAAPGAGLGPQHYLPHDGHFSPAGQRLLADRVAAWMERHGAGAR